MTTSLLELSGSWPYFAGFWLLLMILAALETLWPLHAAPPPTKGRLATNFGIGLLNAALLAFIPFSLVTAALWAEKQNAGLLNLMWLPGWVAAGLTVMLRSLAGYWIHRASHAHHLLWRLHHVHHCDLAIDLSTGFRNHPLETLFVAGCLIGLTMLLGLAPVPLALYETAALAFSLWTHANVQLPGRIERIARYLLVTPAMHRVHHSAARRETDSNYGDIFSVWDRLFGSYRAPDRSGLRAMRFGLGDAYDRNAANLAHQLRAPLVRQADHTAGS